MRYEVQEAPVSYKDCLYSRGETFEVTKEDIAGLLQAGYVKEVEKPKGESRNRCGARRVPFSIAIPPARRTLQPGVNVAVSECSMHLDVVGRSQMRWSALPFYGARTSVTPRMLPSLS
jgi:hypothetical protein